MTIRTATARLDGPGLRLQSWTGSGHAVAMDDAAGETAPRPAEVLMVAQAGCTAMDVVSVLRKKRQRLDGYEIRVTGEQRESGHPHLFERIDILHVVEGDVTAEAVRRAIELSATRYCTVTANLASGAAEIHHRFELHDATGQVESGEVVVTGPYADPDNLGAGPGAHPGLPAGAGPAAPDAAGSPNPTEALARARAIYLDEGHPYGCAETAFIALAEAFALPDAGDSSPAMVFNGGFAYSGATCGALSGAALAVGALAGRRIADHQIAKRTARLIVQQTLDAFRAEHGAVSCRDLLGLDLRAEGAHEAFLESGVWRTRCLAQVESAVRRLAPLADEGTWTATVRELCPEDDAEVPSGC